MVRLDRAMVHWQRRTFGLCWGVYVAAYLGRINLSVAIPFMETSLGLSKTDLGLIGSVFFWVYACGQLVNGRIGDALDARRFIFWGLLASAVANLSFGLAASLWVMVILWALNGYFQSTMWGPLMKTLSLWFAKEQRTKTALGIFTAVVVGFILVWGVLAQIVPHTGWQGAFLLPGCILLVYAFVWVRLARNAPEEVGLALGESLVPSEDAAFQQSSFWRLITGTRLWILGLAAVPLGLVREGIGLWGPTLLYETFALDMGAAFGLAVLIPLFNFLGVIAVRLLLLRHPERETWAISVLFGVSLCSALLLYVFNSTSVALAVLFLAGCSLSLYGATAVFTSIIPQRFCMTSSAAGFLDFAIYIGAGLSGVLTGMISEAFGWPAVILLWVFMGVAGIVSLIFAEVMNKGTRDCSI